MKLTKFFLILLILFTSFQICSSQEKPKADLFDKFGHQVVPEEFAARLEGFLQKIVENPFSQGYVAIHPKKNSINQNFKRERGYERFVKNLISIYKFDKSRITVVRSDEKEEIELEFWIIPPGAEKPFSIEEKWAEYIPDLTKLFVFGFTYPDEIFPNFIPEFYADYLKNNENLRGHIVVFNQSREDANKWIKVLTEEYQVPRNRLKVFFGKTNGSIIYLGKGNLPVEVEFWLVPKKKNK